MLRGNVPALIDLLDLERIETDLFLGDSPETRLVRVYGGQVAAQAMLAATRTVQRQWCLHSLHSYFLRPGDPRSKILFQVERIRDGRSFATRRVVARQGGRAIFSLDASFQVLETGLTHGAPMPRVAAPADMFDESHWLEEARKQDPQFGVEWIHGTAPIEFRWPTSPWMEHLDAGTTRPLCWFRLARPLAPSEVSRFGDVEPRNLHAAIVAYASDYTILDASLRHHADTIDWPNIDIASLDHAMWFHHPIDAGEWLLFVQDSPSTSGARGMNRGLIYREDGVLAASVMQENLMRLREPQAAAP